MLEDGKKVLVYSPEHLIYQILEKDFSNRHTLIDSKESA